MDAPETAEGETSDNYREDFVFNVEGNCTENYTGRQPYPPTLLSPAIFHLYDQRMTNTNTHKHGCADDDSHEIHTNRLFLSMPNFSGCKVRQYNPDILEREWKDLGLSLHLLAEGRWRHSRFFLEKPGKIGLIF